jgi:acyl-CoA hydrolase
MLSIKARLCHVGKSSMDVEVEIEKEVLKQGKVLKVGLAYLTMIALDEKQKPIEVPGLILKTKEDKLRSEQAISRRKERLSR